MKLYNSVGPNPRTVRMFMAERGATAELVKVDVRQGENRREPYLELNPSGTTPTLVLDDGTLIAEITAICEYIDETTPGPSLIGATPLERAETRMWTRRIDLNITEPMTNGFRFAEGLSMFENRIRCIPEAAPALKLLAQEKLAWLDGLIEGRRFICGDRMTLADIMLFAFLDFAAKVGQPINPELSTIPAWFAAMAARPSAAA
jgi:glutathione S-transferase